MLFKATLLLLAGIWICSTTASYSLLHDYTGASFFDGFEFFAEADPTDGHVQFYDETTANNSGIAGIMTGGAANNAVYLGVDSTNVAPHGRGSIRVTSTQAFHHGLFVADIVHMPGGICGTWPAFWLVGQNWPGDGEIDIVEGVNSQQSNKMTLHSDAGVDVRNGTSFSGQLVTANCDINASNQPNNSGCQIADANSDLTFGSAFNAGNGGAFAMEWTSDFIKIWFFQRELIPNDTCSDSPDPTGWGIPNSLFQGNFNMDDHFKNLAIVFDTTFCGQWAGADWNTSSCASKAATCEDFVSNHPEAFADAYWAINSLHVYEATSSSSSTPSKGRRRGGRSLISR